MSKPTTSTEGSAIEPSAERTAAAVARIWFLAIGAMTLLAFRGLWIAPASVDLDALLFLPGGLPALAVVALSGWMVHARRDRLRRVPAAKSAAPARSSLRFPALAGTLVFAGIGTLIFVWATRTGKVDLLLPALSAFAVAGSMAWRGAPGLRAIGLPAFVLLLGLRIPKPLEDELVWLLQRWTAEAAASMLELTGRSFSQTGVILHDAEHTFHVIDSCSGLNGIGILLLISLVVRELHRASGPRLWLVVVLAPPLAFLLNAIRVAVVASSPNPEELAGIEGDHTPQGLAVLMVGTLLLYGVGALLARSKPDAHAEAAPLESAMQTAFAEPNRLFVRSTLVMGALMLASFVIPRFPPARLPADSAMADFPEAKNGWTSTHAPHEPLFTGVFARGFHRRYQIQGGPMQANEIVDLLVAYEDPRRLEATRLLSSKALAPGPDWQLESRLEDRIWALDREIERAVASRPPGSERAFVHVWRPGDRGLARETWRALIGIEASPWARDRPRALVRLVVYARHDGALARDRAKQRLDRFVVAFRDELQAL